MAIIELSTLIIVALIVLAIFFAVKKLFMLAINSVIGFFALFATSFLLPSLQINFWSVIIVAIGGIFGYLAILILHLIGIAF